MTVAGQKPPALAPGRLARWSALLVAAVLAAVVIASESSPATFSERLLGIDARSLFVPEVYEVVGRLPKLQAVLLDVSSKPELLAKMTFAMEKYPAEAHDVLISHGGDADFQQALLDYGDRIVPVIAFFRKTELKSLKLHHTTGQLWDWIFGDRKDYPDRIYGPDFRGLFAVEAIKSEGHKFLAQFAFDAEKKAVWLITPRVITFFTDFFTSGVANVEQKIRTGQKLGAADLGWGAADVVAGAAVLKWIKFLKGAEVLSTTTRTARQADRAAHAAGRVLNRDRVAKALKLSGNAAVVYLTVVHPDLINGLFVDLGAKLGLSAFQSMIIGWSLLLAPIFIWLLPLALSAFAAVVPALLAVASLGAWLRGRPRPR